MATTFGLGITEATNIQRSLYIIFLPDANFGTSAWSALSLLAKLTI